MNSSSVKKVIAKNTLVSMIMRLVYILITFITRSIFIEILGIKVLGLNAVFYNILSMLSLTEMGINSAILFFLYSKVANEDKAGISAVLSFYKKFYRIIGGLIFGLGLVIMPFIHNLKGVEEVGVNIYLVYLLLLINSVITYYVSYKNILLEADQKIYVISVVRYTSLILMNVVRIVMLGVIGSFYIYLALPILFNVISNWFLKKIVDRKYEFLNEYKESRLDSTSRKKIIKNCSALFIHRVSGFLTYGTDNILIAYFGNIRAVGIYDNYYMMINNVNIIVREVLNALRATIGNLVAKQDRESSYKTYKTINFASYYIFGFCTVNLYVLAGPFLTFWLGSQYLMDDSILIILLLNFYITGMITVLFMYRDANGLFSKDVIKSIIEAIVKLLFSFLLGAYYGMGGVFMGTLLSCLCTSFWFEPYLVFYHYFKVPLYEYWKEYIIQILKLLLTIIISKAAFLYLYGGLPFILAALLNCLLVFLLFFVFNYRSKEMQKVLNKIRFKIRSN